MLCGGGGGRSGKGGSRSGGGGSYDDDDSPRYVFLFGAADPEEDDVQGQVQQEEGEANLHRVINDFD